MSNNKEFVLYVSNIPPELNSDGIKAVFGHYGQISGLFHRTETNWAYITYNNYLEAENAIKDLNDTPPMRLKISLKDANKSASVPEKPVSHDIPKPSPSVAATYVHSSVPTSVLRAGKTPNSANTENQESKQETASKKTSISMQTDSSQTNNPYDEIDESVGALWTRGQLTIGPNGQRHVSLGRGYTLYEIPDPHPDHESLIKKVYEKRNVGLFEYEKDALEEDIGKCLVCSKVARLKCGKCHGFYCSQQCQHTDWAFHRDECASIPSLITVTDMDSVLPSKAEPATPSENITSTPVRLRPPKNITKALEENTNTPQQSLNLNNANAHIINEGITFSTQNRLSSTEFTVVKIVLKINEKQYWVQMIESADALGELMVNLQDDANDSPSVDPVIGNMYATKYDDIWHRCIVTSLTPLKVNFIDFGNDEILTNPDLRECKTYKNIPHFAFKIQLSDNARQFVENLKEDDVLSVKMVSMDNDMVINVKLKQEEESPAPIVTNNIVNTDKPVQSETIKVSDIAPVKQEILLNTTSTDAIESIVTDMPNNIEPEKPNRSVILEAYEKMKSALDDMDLADEGFLQMHEELGQNIYSTTILPYTILSKYKKQMMQMQNKCEESTEDQDRSLEQLVCGQTNTGKWLRGYALADKTPCKMISIDEARIITVKKIVLCPEEYTNIPAVGVACNTQDINKFDVFQHEFIITKLNSGANKSAEIEITMDTGKVKANLTLWKPDASLFPTMNQPTTQVLELKNNCKVSVTSYLNQKVLFVRPLFPEEVERCNRVMQDVAKCAQTAPTLKQDAKVGQMVIAPYVDGNFYRAIIRELKGATASVFFIDYGDTEQMNTDRLKKLPTNLATMRPCARKVALRDVPIDIPMTKDVDDYLAMLVGKEVPLICRFEGVPHVSGVRLEQLHGESVNDKITELLIPNWKREKNIEDKECYSMTELKNIEIGKVGDTVMAFVLNVFQDSEYALCVNNKDAISYIRNTLPNLIKEYAECKNYYIPREKELCLAKFENKWYRGACIVRNKTQSTSFIFFVDCGNFQEIDHKDIRVMTKDFMTPDALACLCTIQNLAPRNSNNNYPEEIGKRISSLILPDTSLKVKIIKFLDIGYDVEVPDIRKILIDEKLIEP